MKHYTKVSDASREQFVGLIDLGIELKKELKNKGFNAPFLKNKTLAMVFEKPSLRTRVSFEVGMTELGGHAIYLAPADIGLGTRETIEDISRTLSEMADAVMMRVFKHTNIEKFASVSSVPVINGLSDLSHPCQALADLMTVYEVFGSFKGITIAYVGDANNNVCHSLALASALLGVNFKVGSPKNYQMQRRIIKEAEKLNSNWSLEEYINIEDAVQGANVVYTDTWVSMGSEDEKSKRLKDLKDFQVTGEIMDLASNDAVFMHCLPAYRGNETTSDVVEGSQSVVFQQAGNRLHAQKALLVNLMTSDPNVLSKVSVFSGSRSKSV